MVQALEWLVRVSSILECVSGLSAMETMPAKTQPIFC